MELPQYEFAPDDGCTFYFISKGKNGVIKKIIHYEEIAEGIFNLTLADNNPITGEWEDSAVTANDDTEKILATVVKSVYLFTERYPNAYVYAKGSTHSRNRLYRKGITKYLTQALEDFIIWGELENEEFEYFNSNSDYEAFIIQRKTKELW